MSPLTKGQPTLQLLLKIKLARHKMLKCVNKCKLSSAKKKFLQKLPQFQSWFTYLGSLFSFVLTVFLPQIRPHFATSCLLSPTSQLPHTCFHSNH